MSKEKLIKELERQLSILRTDGEFKVIEFRVWYAPNDIPLIRHDSNTWSWGHCRSDTCNHVSHDPYQKGDTVWILCKSVGRNENGNEYFITPVGICFEYDNRETETHYSPHASINIYKGEQ